MKQVERFESVNNNNKFQNKKDNDMNSKFNIAIIRIIKILIIALLSTPSFVQAKSG